MTRSRGTALFVTTWATVAALLAGPVPSTQGVAQAFDCGATDSDAVRWLGGPGAWTDASKWSGGNVPGLTGRDDQACIPPGSDIVVGLATTVDLEAFELAGDSTLLLQPGSSLFVWGDQQLVRSVVRPMSVIEVDGATLGGAGRLRVMGTLLVHKSTAGEPALLSTRPASSRVGRRAGLLEIGDAGTLRIDGTGNVRLAKRYVVDVRGRATLSGDAGLVADHGTSFLLQHRIRSKGVGKLVILNDRGIVSGRWNGIRSEATFVNDGLVVKRDSAGVSRIDVRYFGGGAVVEKTGDVRYVILVEDLPFTGPCGAADYCSDEQDADVRIPVTDSDGASVVVTSAGRVKGSVGVALRVQVSDLEATAADPVVMRLGYRVSALRRAGASSNPAELDVARAEGADNAYVEIPDCTAHTIPFGSTACLDRAASTRTVGGGVELVVRTVQLSRWIAR